MKPKCELNENTCPIMELLETKWNPAAWYFDQLIKLNISKNQKLILAVIIKRSTANYGTDWAHISNEVFELETGVSRSTIPRITKLLIEKGYFEKCQNKPPLPNSYRLINDTITPWDAGY